MPKRLELKLKLRVARKHPGWSKKHKNRYIYGALRNTGWKPKR